MWWYYSDTLKIYVPNLTQDLNPTKVANSLVITINTIVQQIMHLIVMQVAWTCFLVEYNNWINDAWLHVEKRKKKLHVQFQLAHASLGSR